MSDIDKTMIERFLDNAQFHAHPEGKNDWAEGFWLGRAVQHAEQNAVDHDWLIEQFQERHLDEAVISIPRPGESSARFN